MSSISSYGTKAGKLYRVRYRTPDGKQTQRRGFRTKREAQQFLATVETSMLKGEYVAPTLGRVTIGELGPAWLARQQGHLKASSAAAYEGAWRVNVQPRWGDTRASDVRFSAVQAWVAELSSTLGAESVKVAYGVLARILDDAVKDRMLASNPGRGVKLPKRPPRRNVYLTADQLDMLATESGRYRSLVLLLGVGGLRWGEAAALRRRDVNFLRRRVELHCNAVAVRGQMIVGSLKSGKSRIVVLPAFVVDELSRTCEGKGPDELLWPSVSGGYQHPPRVRSWLSRAVTRCQDADPSFPRITAHDLRHTAASLAISAGANPKVVQTMLGHASAAMTLDVYADLFDSDLESVAANVAKMWPRGGQTGTIGPG
jgi:integrase